MASPCSRRESVRKGSLLEGDGVANTGNNWTRNEHGPEGEARKFMKTGAPGEIRTPDLLLRRAIALSF